MSYYQQLSSQLQSRIAKRTSNIAQAEHWKQYHRALEQMSDYRAAKSLIADLTAEQQLDRKLFKVMQQLAHAEQEYDKLSEKIARTEKIWRDMDV